MSDTLVFVCGDADQYTAMAEPMRELGWETEMVDPASATALETIEATAPVATVFNLATGPEQAVHELAKAMLGDPDLPRPCSCSLAATRVLRGASSPTFRWRVRGRRRAHLGAQTPRVQGLRLLVSRQIYWVVPAYNEAASIADLIDRIAEVSTAAGWRWSMIVVDDGSADTTGDIARGKAADGLPVEVLRNEPNAGLGVTIRRGLRTASEAAGTDDVIITLDADLTQDPGYAPALVAKLDEGYDVVVASRYRPGSGVEGLSALRRLLSYTASAMVTLVRPIRGVRDYSCGFRAYRSNIVAHGFSVYGDDFVSERGFACMLEIAERLRKDAAFAEVPFVLRYQETQGIGDQDRAHDRGVLPRHRQGRFDATQAGARRDPGGRVLGDRVQLHGAAPAAIGDARVGQPQRRGYTRARGTPPTVLGGLMLYAVSSALWLGVLSRMELSLGGLPPRGERLHPSSC